MHQSVRLEFMNEQKRRRIRKYSDRVRAEKTVGHYVDDLKTAGLKVEQLTVLGKIKRESLNDQSPADYARWVFSELRKIIAFDNAFVLVFDWEKQFAFLLASSPSEPDDADMLRWDLPEKPSAVGIRDFEPFLRTFSGTERSRDWLNSQLKTDDSSRCMLPILSYGELIGLVYFSSKGKGSFHTDEREIIKDAVDSLTVALQKNIMFEQTRKRASDLEQLRTITDSMRISDSSSEIIRILIQESGNVVSADMAIFIDDEFGNVYYLDHGELVHHPDTLADQTKRNIFSGINGEKQLRVFAEDHIINGQHYRMNILIPVLSGEVLLGRVILLFRGSIKLTGEEQKLLASIADISGNALMRLSVVETLEERVKHRTVEIETLYHISQNIIQSEEPDQFLDSSLGSICSAADADFGLILITQDDKKQWFFHGEELIDTDQKKELCALALASKQEVRTISGNMQVMMAGVAGFRKGYGEILMCRLRPVPFTPDEVNLLKNVSAQISVGYEDAMLRRQVKEVIVMEERQRMARELHDSVSQLLYSQTLFVQASKKALKSGNYELLDSFLERQREISDQAFRELRLMIYSLRPRSLETDGLEGALQNRLDVVEKRTGIDTRLEIQPNLGLSSECENNLYRLTEEAINNTLKHASATMVSVKLFWDGDILRLEILDNGKGFDPETISHGFGLDSMKERTESLGGRIDIRSAPEKGTVITAAFPDKQKLTGSRTRG